jgi:hypothetical protein
MNDQEFVLAKYPRAECFGPVNLYWPGQGTRRKYIVTSAPHMSRTEGEGDTPAEAWTNAAVRIKAVAAAKKILPGKNDG